MLSKRLPLRDPRTVARDIPGILDAIFPHLNAGLVTLLTRDSVSFPYLQAIPERALESSTLTRAMLFELAVAHAEQAIAGIEPDSWEKCLSVAVTRQQRYFDATFPTTLGQHDIFLANWSSRNLQSILGQIQDTNQQYALTISPKIPGFRWIASANADFCLGPLLIEIKHTNRNFLSADFRQVLMYWMLSYAASLESNYTEFSDCIFINPRRNSGLAIKFSKLIRLASPGLNKLELVQLFEFDSRGSSPEDGGVDLIGHRGPTI